MWLFLLIPLRKAISTESSRRDILIHMIADRFIFKNYQIYALPLFHHHTKTRMGLSKPGVSFYSQWSGGYKFRIILVSPIYCVAGSAKTHFCTLLIGKSKGEVQKSSEIGTHIFHSLFDEIL